MASSAQIEANRRNALQSTGPKSAAGKAKSSQNAFRHGLSRGVQVDPKRVKHMAETLIAAMGIASHEAEAIAEAHAVASKASAQRFDIMRQLAIPHGALDPFRPQTLDALFRCEERARRRKQRLMRKMAGMNVRRTKIRNSAKRSQT